MADTQDDKERRARIDLEERLHAMVSIGTKEALIAAGRAKPEQFPGEPGCGKTSTVFPATPERRKMAVKRRSTYLYEVHLYRTKEEAARYFAEVTQRIEHMAASGEARSSRYRAPQDAAFQRFMAAVIGKPLEGPGPKQRPAGGRG